MTARRPLRRLHLFTVLALVALGLGVMPAIVHATTITVTTTADENGTGSACSLREAIHAANQDTAFGGCAAGSGVDTISVPAGTYTLTVAVALDITSSLTISGAGRSATVIASNNRFQVFDIQGAGETVTIAQVAVRGMDATGPGEAYQGVIIRQEATLVLTSSSISGSDSAIANEEGTLDLTDSDVRGGSRYTVGGGIRNTGRASVLRSTITGSVGGEGGGIANRGEMTIVNSSVSGNALDTGGILNRGELTLRNSTVHNSEAMVVGGIDNSGTMTVINSTISHNRAVSAAGISNSGTMTVTNSTISNNRADLQSAGISNRGTLSINNSTISANSVTSDSQEEDSTGGGIVNHVGTVTLANTILAGNSAEVPGTADCVGTLTSAGYNLIGVTSGCTITGDTTGNKLGVNPRLGPLQNNGGPTRTHALLASSPAIDAGNPAQVGSGGAACEATDQRGVARPADGDGNGSRRCDIGAYEREPAAPATPTRTPTTQPTTGPALQRVYLPLVMNLRQTSP